MKIPKCAACKPKYCHEGPPDESVLPPFCPMLNFKELVKDTKQKYAAEDIHPLFLNAALIERESYDETFARERGKTFPIRPRIREISAFAEKMGAERIGVAFCIGLADEAGRAVAILESHGLEICSAACSCGAVDKTELGIPAEEKIREPRKFEAACNPILQARLFNAVKTDFNVIIGLCLGHDMLFTQHAEAPVTTLIVKDRFTGHNPVIALYSRYHKDLV